MLSAYLDSLSTFAMVALTFLLMIALLRLARWLLERLADVGEHVEGWHAIDTAHESMDAAQADAEAPPTLSAVAGGEHSGTRLGDENGYLGTGLR